MKKPTLTSKIGTAAKLLTYAENIVQKSTENAELFVEAAEQLTELESALAAYRNALAEASYGDRRLVVIKDQQAAILKNVLYKYSLYVDGLANGDASIILAAGFIPSKSTVQPASGPSPKPNDLRAEVKHTGTNSVQLQVNSWAKARYYQFEYRKVGSLNEWNSILSTKSKVLVQELERLAEYEFRVTYLGNDPTPNYSDTARCVVV